MIHTIHGTVIHGDALGRKLGFRTANIDFQDENMPSAVFKVHVIVRGELYSGM